MSKKPKTNSKKSPVSGVSYVQTVAGIEEYQLKSNGLRILYLHKPNTGVVTTNITYLVGAKDEARGETGLAHMLEHMLFKPTEADVKNKIDSASMEFERTVGCVLNANTWKDRTTYYFVYPSEYFERAVQIESERINGVILTDESLAPERNNVLSEFDMVNGNPHFALSVQMAGVAFQSHPYGHETIGYREDIEDYTAEKLERFYRNYYRPDNAVMMVIGDVDKKHALEVVKKNFSEIKNPETPIPRFKIRESKQEGIRRIEVKRPSNTNIVSIGFKHAPFPTKACFEASLFCEVIANNDESILNQMLVDKGIATSVSASVSPFSEEYLGEINVMLAEGQKHKEVEEMVLEQVAKLDAKKITDLVKKAKAKMLTDELFSREKSQDIAAELTEYVASGNWEAYAKTPDILKEIATKDILNFVKKTFVEEQLTIGYFIGT